MNSSDKFVIEHSYCVDNLHQIRASLFTKNKTNNFFILDLPKNRAKYSVSSLKIISKFKKNDINITDLSRGVVIFKNCKMPINLKKIKMQLIKKFKQKFSSIKISSIHVSSPSSLSPNLSFYKFEKLDLKSNSYKRSNGTFKVLFKKGKYSKNIYLKYNINATIAVYKAKYNLRNGKILQDNDYIKRRIKFERLPAGVITGDIKNDYIIKGYIRKNEILRNSQFKIKKDLLKGDFVKAVLTDENLLLEVDAHLLSDANIGDIVQIRTTNGKVFQAKIVSLKTAKIME